MAAKLEFDENSFVTTLCSEFYEILSKFTYLSFFYPKLYKILNKIPLPLTLNRTTPIACTHIFSRAHTFAMYPQMLTYDTKIMRIMCVNVRLWENTIVITTC